jgi:fructose-1,6-bisphosphatase/inositol monophosphatase family enzyme
VVAAASVARELEGRAINRPKAGESSAARAALTEADLRCQEAILEATAGFSGHVRLDAEEDTPGVARFTGRERHALVVIDPIDGTLHCYLEGRGPYAVMVGLALQGRFEAALIALPREDLIFEATAGGGARIKIGSESWRGARLPAGGSRVLVTSGTPEPVRDELKARGYEVSLGSGGAIALAPLLPGVLAGLRVVRGGRSVSRRGRIGLLIAKEAGAVISTDEGKPFPADIDSPASSLVVAGSVGDRDAILGAVSQSY